MGLEIGEFVAVNIRGCVLMTFGSVLMPRNETCIAACSVRRLAKSCDISHSPCT